ncbi:hypothetical protein IG631_17995 [Alternaria alternata]|nr:hypothetical protein IG631_17995 [Alternaria alternata]
MPSPPINLHGIAKLSGISPTAGTDIANPTPAPTRLLSILRQPSLQGASCVVAMTAYCDGAASWCKRQHGRRCRRAEHGHAPRESLFRVPHGSHKPRSS